MRTAVVGPSLALLLVLLAVAAPVGAQAPPASGVEISGEATKGTISVEQTASFKFTVKNTSPASGTPLDAQDEADVAITFEAVPQDWTVSATPQSFRLARGQSATTEVQVTVPTGSDVKHATIAVVAILTPATSNLPPLLDPVEQEPASAKAPLELQVQNSVTRDVIEALGPWIYVVLLLLVAAIVVAVAVTVSSRRTLVRLAADTREQVVAPGGKVSFPFRVEGLARDTDTILLQTSAVQEGWAAFLPVPELVMEPGQAQDLNLVVIAPRSAAQGARQAVLVTATSSRAPKGAANLEFVAVVEGVEDLPTAPRRAK
ncbi:MAG: hypothetical protein ACYC2H_10505 [Thermoplasmatota archaeon]